MDAFVIGKDSWISIFKEPEVRELVKRRVCKRLDGLCCFQRKSSPKIASHRLEIKKLHTFLKFFLI